jgi:hypothetical protein
MTEACAYTVDVVSPQFPCGAAWLANALLELQVPLPHLWGFETAAEWQDVGDGVSRYAAMHGPWRQTLASLWPGREFHFVQGVRPRFTHAFPWQLAPNQRTVWMVRDPRDALYSEWRRHQRNEGLSPAIDLPEFLRSPFLGGPVSVVDMLWLHLRAWQAVAQACPEQVLVLRFEDWKKRPVESLATVVRWIGVDACTEALQQACAASDVSRLQAIEQALALDDAQSRQFNRRGAVLEWEGTWPRSWYSAMGPEWLPLLHFLGYAPLQETGAPAPVCNLVEFLAWRGADGPQQRGAWTSALQPINAARRAST